MLPRVRAGALPRGAWGTLGQMPAALAAPAQLLVSFQGSGAARGRAQRCTVYW
jgi:hypothetical protein